MNSENEGFVAKQPNHTILNSVGLFEAFYFWPFFLFQQRWVGTLEMIQNIFPQLKWKMELCHLYWKDQNLLPQTLSWLHLKNNNHHFLEERIWKLKGFA